MGKDWREPSGGGSPIGHRFPPVGPYLPRRPPTAGSPRLVHHGLAAPGGRFAFPHLIAEATPLA